MKLCCSYIETDKFEEVVKFYEKVFQVKGNVYTENRWIEFDFGNKLSIYNIKYDIDKIENGSPELNYNDSYIKNFNKEKEEPKNNIITLNFYTDNLLREYERIKELNICETSDIMYVNITEPYYYFNIIDPVGNTIEICGEYIG